MKSTLHYPYFYTILLHVLLLVICTSRTHAQNSDCATAISVCNATYDENNSPAGTGNVFEMSPGSCQTGGEFNSAWYVFSPQDDGVLSFILEPDNNNDDYDWSLFDITENGCGGINSGASPEVSCNSYGETGGFQGPTGISSAEGGFGSSNGPGNTNGPAFNEDLNVQQGNVYALVIMNYSATLNGYTLNFGESASSIYDETAPLLESMAIDCERTTMTLTYNENINLNTTTGQSITVFMNGTNYSSNSVTTFSGGDLDNVLVVTFPDPLPGGVASIQPGITGNISDVCGNPWTQFETYTLNQVVQITDVVTNAACNGEDGSFEVFAEGESGPFEMSVNGNPENGLSMSALAPGTYTIELEDLEGCLDETTIDLEDVIINVDAGDNLVLCDMDVILAGNVSAGNILWNGPSDLTFSNSSSAASMVTADDPGTYALELTSTWGDCTATDDLEIEFNLPPQIDLTIEHVTCAEFCDGKLQVSNQAGNSVTFSFLGQVVIGESAEYDNVCSGTSLLEVDFGGNCIATYPVTIDAPPAIDVNIDIDHQILELPAHEVICSGTVQNADSISWTVIEEPLMQSSESIWYLSLPSESGYYTIQLIGINDQGCSAQARSTVWIRDDFAFYVPNSFTPNGDGINDVFLPEFTYWPDAYEFCIYDRWGACIWQTNNPTDAWTGDVRGGEYFVHDGAYHWMMKYQDKSEEAQIVMGYVTIWR